MRTKKDRITFNRNNLTGIISILVCFFIVFSWHYLFDIKRIAGSDIRFLQDDWEIAWNPSSKMANRSPLGHHIYDAYKTLSKKLHVPNQEEMKQVDEWLKWNNESLPDNEYKGIAKGKNVVFLQIEALEDFVINQKYMDKK